MAHAEHPHPVTLTPERVHEAFAPHVDPTRGEAFGFMWHPLDPEIVGYVVRPEFQDVEFLPRHLWVRGRLQKALGHEA